MAHLLILRSFRTASATPILIPRALNFNFISHACFVFKISGFCIMKFCTWTFIDFKKVYLVWPQFFVLYCDLNETWKTLPQSKAFSWRKQSNMNSNSVSCNWGLSHILFPVNCETIVLKRSRERDRYFVCLRLKKYMVRNVPNHMPILQNQDDCF